jgi:hypothetical protein
MLCALALMGGVVAQTGACAVPSVGTAETGGQGGLAEAPVGGATAGFGGSGGSSGVAASGGAGATGASGGYGGSGPTGGTAGSNCTGRRSWIPATAMNIADGEEIEHQGIRYRSVGYHWWTNPECAPDNPVDWCANWFELLGPC